MSKSRWRGHWRQLHDLLVAAVAAGQAAGQPLEQTYKQFAAEHDLSADAVESHYRSSLGVTPYTDRRQLAIYREVAAVMSTGVGVKLALPEVASRVGMSEAMVRAIYYRTRQQIEAGYVTAEGFPAPATAPTPGAIESPGQDGAEGPASAPEGAMPAEGVEPATGPPLAEATNPVADEGGPGARVGGPDQRVQELEAEVRHLRRELRNAHLRLRTATEQHDRLVAVCEALRTLAVPWIGLDPIERGITAGRFADQLQAWMGALPGSQMAPGAQSQSKNRSSSP